MNRKLPRWLWLPVLLVAIFLLQWSTDLPSVALAGQAPPSLLAFDAGGFRPEPAPQTGQLIGLITNTQSGQRLVGVAISVAGQVTQTNSSGVYLFNSLPAGAHTASVAHPGFNPVTKSVNVVADQTRWHSMALTPLESSTPTATLTPSPTPTSNGQLIGLVTNAATGERLVGAAVSAAGQMVQSNSRGVYLFDTLPSGEHTLSVAHPGFSPVTKSVNVVANQTRWHSLTLTPLDTPAPTATSTPSPSPTPTATSTPILTPVPATGQLIGLITNAATGERLVGVAASAAGQIVQSNSRGLYLFDALPAGPHLVSVDHPGFEPIARTATVVAGQTRWNSLALTPLEPPTPTATATVEPPAPCDPIPGESYGTLAVVGPPTDRPAAEHADLNLALRGYRPTTAYLGLIDLPGSTDVRAPQLAGLFADNRTGVFSSVYQVFHWDWSTNTRGGPITDFAVTLAGLQVEPGETIHVPISGYSIGQGYNVLVLYADQERITLKYTGEDNVVAGYTLHVEGICVEPSLLALYEQMNATGRQRLPALRAGQAFGRAHNNEVQVAIRDAGRFMDPRVRKDWWQGR